MSKRRVDVVLLRRDERSGLLGFPTRELDMLQLRPPEDHEFQSRRSS